MANSMCGYAEIFFNRSFCTMLIFILFLSILQQVCNTTEVLRPRGVPLSKKVFYDPGKEFTCLDGSASFPFVYVNDDYCDCTDASDEPGTAACPNGKFHCNNLGYVAKDIPSSRVNDGICDCCDASDEYNSSSDCVNYCNELGEQAREEANRMREILVQGYELKKAMCNEGKERREESRKKLEELTEKKSSADQLRNEKEAIKKDADEKEKVALEKYKTEEDDTKKKEEEAEMAAHQEEDRRKAIDAFNDLDLDMNQILTYQELQSEDMFDQNRDGVVSEDEARFFLHMKDEMELEEFVSTGWMIMKPIYLARKTAPVEYVPQEPKDSVSEPSEESTEEEDQGQDERDEDDMEDEELESPPPLPQDSLNTEDEETKESKYDEETQQLIDAAKAARDEYYEADRNLRNLENEIRDLEEDLNNDYGPEGEFSALKGQCFEYTDREYTYKLCPFDRATQQPKSGGSETHLGKWGKWVGPEDDKYSQMKYDGGLSCWNGPARSVVVNVQCGVENKLDGASEPSRCEYMFNFYTPAMCSAPPPVTSGHIHSEL